LCKINPYEFECEIIIQNLASEYLVCKNCLGKEKNMQKVIDYANEGLRLINQNTHLKEYTRFHFLIGKAYSKLSGKENLLKAREAFKEVLKYKDQPWYEAARDDLWYVEQDLRYIDKGNQ